MPSPGRANERLCVCVGGAGGEGEGVMVIGLWESDEE